MSEEREMTLAEWVGRLPQPHLAHREYTKLKARIEALEKALTIIRDGEAFLGLGDCPTASELAAEALLQEPTK